MNAEEKSNKVTIRRAKSNDLSRIAEIFVLNNRIHYFPIFQDPEYSFSELQVVSAINHYFGKEEVLSHTYVFDDGLIKGFIQIEEKEIVKLYVDPFFQKKESVMRSFNLRWKIRMRRMYGHWKRI